MSCTSYSASACLCRSASHPIIALGFADEHPRLSNGVVPCCDPPLSAQQGRCWIIRVQHPYRTLNYSELNESLPTAQASRSGCSCCTRASSSLRSSASPSWRSSSRTTPSDDRRRCLLVDAIFGTAATVAELAVVLLPLVLRQPLRTPVACRHHAQADGFCAAWLHNHRLMYYDVGHVCHRITCVAV